MKIFIVEDEKFLREYMHRYLDMKSFTVESFADAEAFLESAVPSSGDCLILDINLPGINGFEVSRVMKERLSGLNVFIISAMHDTVNIAEAFATGCIDYLKKPFELEELAIRIKHRCENTSTSEIVCGQLHYQPAGEQFSIHQETIDLSRTQSLLLKTFIEHRNSLVTYGYLMDTLWWDRPVSRANISVHVNTLKKRYPILKIKTVHGLGYRLECP